MARRRGRGRGGVTVQVRGTEALRRRLEALPDDIKAGLRRAVRESAEAVRDGTAQGVRVDTGNLRESVDARYADDGLRAEVGWVGRDDDYAHHHEFGTSAIPAQPALGPAAEQERARIVQRVRNEVRRSLS